MSVTQIKNHKKAQIETDSLINNTSFGLLRKKVKRHGILSTMKYLWKLNKRLTPEQQNRNREYIRYLVKKV